MAKPIRATPELYKKDAKRFLSLMAKKERSKMTKKERALARAVIKVLEEERFLPFDYS